ncbi:hypothetical protein L1987_87150 [Smallanthus sonchifolius]|nr:hypothetical protein L1987_89433 [Smallanthus sonchifolius]KAI3666359.1 hypothetical protein L1987_89133 [Smallanthus sonchifolius]KAI3666600.1 hypothetical protein L1987_88879 [Smallanthus sonchifolius]KAI3668461.1 hypothetical protein L1987_88542 [Smallanthus sonchifolius]KAI3671741.1 hypothetical protein L1987_87150 [Smallanthus sonchifolius]
MSGFSYSSAGSTCPRFEEFDDRPSLQKTPELFDSESAGLEESGATRIFNGFESLLIPGGRPNSMEFAISQACQLSKERPVRICSFFLFLFERQSLKLIGSKMKVTGGGFKPNLQRKGP